MSQTVLDPSSAARRPSRTGRILIIVLAFHGLLVGAYFLFRPATDQADSADTPASKPTTPVAASNAPPKPAPPAPTPAPAIPKPAPPSLLPPVPVPTVPAAPTPPAAAPAQPTQRVVPQPAAPAPVPAPSTPVRTATLAPIVPPANPAQTSSTADRATIDRAKTALAAGNPGEVRDILQPYLETARDPALRFEAEEVLGNAHVLLVFSPRPMKEKVDYTVQIGDSLEKIAKKFGTSVALIKTNNTIKGTLIRADQRLRVFSGTFRVLVDKSDNTLTVFLNDRFFKRYRVGTGEYSRTPTGSFAITDKIAQPTWWHPDGKVIPYGDPGNLLGTHWLALNVRGYGIHGTWEPDTIGRQSSLGCVRMLNHEVEQLFALLPIGTTVVVQE